MNLDFYRAFEDRHRGTRESILERQRVYLPFLEPLAAAYPGAGVVDVGCGRGEWLELLRNVGVPARGADLDEGMLAACRERGLDVQQQDAVAFLRGLPDASQIAVSGFHIAEHLPFEVLQELAREALRVLLPGGLLVLETPNPENLQVGTTNFYLDPTHERPLPALLLQFLAEHTGFARAKVIRLQEPPELHGRERLTLLDVLAGASPDYALVAQKSGAPAATEVLNPLFARDFGLRLDELAYRYDRKLKEDIHLASVNAADALAQAERARTASEAAHEYAINLHRSIEAQMRHEMAELRQQVADSLEASRAATAQELQALLQRSIAFEQQLLAVYNSRSWRVTAPLRAATDVLRRGRDATMRSLSPELVARVAAWSRRLGVYGPLRAVYRRFRGTIPPGGATPAGAWTSAAEYAAAGGMATPAGGPAAAGKEEALSASERRALQRLDQARSAARNAP